MVLFMNFRYARSADIWASNHDYISIQSMIDDLHETKTTTEKSPEFDYYFYE